MYSGELEVQAKRKTIAILHDQTNNILNFSRELAIITEAFFKGDNEGIAKCFEKTYIIEDDIMSLRKQITREVTAIGSFMDFREDLLRTAFLIDEISGYLSGITFRLSNIDPKLVRDFFETDLKNMMNLVIDAIFKINEMSRSLAIKPDNTIELAIEVQKIEVEADKKYRELSLKALTYITATRDLILFKDTIEGIEGLIDKCQQASNSFTILALVFDD